MGDRGLLLGRYGGFGAFSLGNTDDFVMTEQTPGADVSSPFYTDGDTWFAIVRGTGIVTSTDGLTWTLHPGDAGDISQALLNAAPVRRVGDLFYHPNPSVAPPPVQPSDRLYSSTDGLTWTFVYTPEAGAQITDVDGDGAGELVIVGQYADDSLLIQRLVGGVGTDATVPTDWTGQPNRVVRDPVHDTYLVTGGFVHASDLTHAGSLLRSTDGGATFTAPAEPAGMRGQGEAAYSPDDGYLYVAVETRTAFPQTLIRSGDGGATWETVPTPFDGDDAFPGVVSSIAVGRGTIDEHRVPVIVIVGSMPGPSGQPLEAYVRPLAGSVWAPISATAHDAIWPAALGGPGPVVSRPPLSHRQRQDGVAAGGPPLSHIGGASNARPDLGHRQNTP